MVEEWGRKYGGETWNPPSCVITFSGRRTRKRIRLREHGYLLVQCVNYQLNLLFSVLDIDTIEVRSDDEVEETGTIRARRVYNYRVSEKGGRGGREGGRRLVPSELGECTTTGLVRSMDITPDPS